MSSFDNSRDSGYFRVVSAWTKAGVSSCVHIRSQAEDILLDCGVNESSTFSAKIVLITHGHIDHAGCCINHARGKALNSGTSTYFVPPIIKDPLLQAKAAYEMMDDREIPMNIVALSPGESVEISPTVRVLAFRTIHRVPSQGYAIFKKWKGKLLPKFEDLPSKELGRLKKEGVNIYGDPYETLEVVYTGDTIFDGLLLPENAFIFSANLFFIELTYIDGERSKALNWSHVHIDDIVDNELLFKKVKSLVFVHLSSKYSVSRAIETIRMTLSASLIQKCEVSLRSFGAREHLTYLGSTEWEEARHREPGWGWSSNKQPRLNR
jgi:ribonuclease Z